MHTAPLPPGHLVRAALLALALTVATLLVFAAAPGLDFGAGGSEPAAGEPARSAPAAAPRWLEDPLASPALELARR